MFLAMICAFLSMNLMYFAHARAFDAIHVYFFSYFSFSAEVSSRLMFEKKIAHWEPHDKACHLHITRILSRPLNEPFEHCFGWIFANGRGFI